MIVTKFGTEKQIENEILALRCNDFGLDFIPKLIDVGKDGRSVRMSYVGERIENKKGRLKFLQNKVEKLGNQFQKATGYHHGDLQIKNLCILGEKYHLIDFENLQVEHGHVECSRKTCKCYDGMKTNW